MGQLNLLLCLHYRYSLAYGVIDIEAAVINPEMPFEQIRDAVNNQAGIIDFAELDKRNYIILDTETTGLGDADEVVELGITDKYGNKWRL